MTTHPLRLKSSHYLFTMLLLSGTLAASIWSDHRDSAVLVKPIDTIDKRIGSWNTDGNRELRDTIVASLGATSYLSRIYRKDRSELDMFVAFYAQQRTGETMHSPKYCLPGGGWEFSDFRTITLSPAGRTVKINRAAIRRGDERQVLLYWYQSRARIVASEYQSKLFLVWDGLTRANQGGSIVRVMFRENPGAEQEGLAFATQLIPEIQKCLGTE